ncbi:universal stress protein [Massilia sp. CCM 9210]|uniref:universal stress protein n=1 Tax=Massilia scottii TaxID=3057166 RepID=UPI00279655FC|nr:universal stress protein [Massilia sp. CCM 9210]MDQ1815973.1 universal stress protein [Massilia sp. CCM 9210]
MYKTILVHVDASAGLAARVELAARMAIAHDAHLVGVAPTGLSAYMYPLSAMGAGMPPIAFPIEEVRAGAERSLDLFESGARQLGVNSLERRMVDEEVGDGLCLQARYADLVVIGAPAADTVFFARPGVAGHVLLNCARPVLVTPAAGAGGAIGKRVTVAWNGSAEAVRAITSALPLLQGAAHVDLVVAGKNGHADLYAEQPGADIALYLARHGVKVDVSMIDGGDDDGESLLSFAARKGADLIVMGAFGRSRLREFVLGGATRTALLSSPIPLWMAH